MAKEARDHNSEYVWATILEPEHKSELYFCCGTSKDSSKECGAPLRLICKNEQGHHFSLIPARGKHIIGCEYSCARKVHQIKTPNPDCSTWGLSELSKHLAAKVKANNKTSVIALPQTDDESGQSSDDNTDSRGFVKVDAQVRSIKVLYERCEYIVNAPLMEHEYIEKINEIYLYKNSVDSYRNNPELLCNKDVLVTCCRGLSYRSVHHDGDGIILVDAFKQDDAQPRPIYFELGNVSKDVRDLIFNPDKSSRFVVYSGWIPDDRDDALFYRSKNTITINQIMRI